MAENELKTEKHDDLRINIKKRHEINYWTNQFAISEGKLRDAIHKVGPIVKDVREYLQENKTILPE